MKRELSEEGKEQFALALILLKDFKAEGRLPSIELMKEIQDMADYIGCREQMYKLTSVIPVMKITPR